jgi:hypothetical protein
LLEAAYREFPDSRILVNIALTQHALGRLLEAAATCERFLADPNRAADQVAKVTNELAAIDAKLARLEIVVVAPTGAAIEVQVDDGAVAVVAEPAGPRAARRPSGPRPRRRWHRFRSR